jgi:hypothetical protein
MPNITDRIHALLAAERLARARGHNAIAAVLAEQRRLIQDREERS